MQFISEQTNIPVPKLYGCFEDDGAAYLIMAYVEGVTMNELSADGRKVVETELEGYLEDLRSLKSAVWGGPSGIVSSGYARACLQLVLLKSSSIVKLTYNSYRSFRLIASW